MTNENETPELLPCPFCGSSEVNPEGWYRMTTRVFGGDCVVLGLACDECGSSAKTIDAWNTRADLADKRIEELEAQLAAMTAERDRLEQRYQREVLGLNNEGDPIGGHPPIGLKARAEAAEAKLVKAVQFTGGVLGYAGNIGDDYLAEQARAAFAELKGTD
jgi:hypothetical protein